VTRTLAVTLEVDVDVVETRARRILLCTDGLIFAWDDEDAARVPIADLCERTPIEDVARALVDAACARGARDNVTAIVVERD
jgi:serine/threonine protein phosphatase PrpC